MAKKGTELVAWQEELAKQAQEAAAQEASSGGGQFFSTKSGVLSFNGSPIPNNEMGVVIVDGIIENVYYPGEYDPDNRQGPACYAFGRDEKTMAPKAEFVAEPQSEGCPDCAFNKFGSAEKGRGKACKNRRRLALISAGDFDKAGEFTAFDDTEHFAKATVGYLPLPVTSVNGYAAWVKQVAAVEKRPPHGVFAKVSLVPDPKTQFKIVFETLGLVPNELMGAIMARNKEQRGVIEFPYQKAEDAPAKPAARRQALPKRTAAPQAAARASTSGPARTTKSSGAKF